MKRALSFAFFFLFLSHINLHAETEATPSPSRVIEQYIKALELDPSDSNSRYYLGISYLHNANYTKGIEELLKVYPEREDDPEISFNLGYAYLQLKRYDDSFKYFTMVQESGRGGARRFKLDSAFLNLGMNLQQSGDSEKALLCFKNALDINPESIKIHLMLADLYSRSGDNIKALEYLERARSIDEKDEELIGMISRIHNRLGVVYLGEKRYSEARMEFNRVLKVDSSNLYTIYYIGYIDYLEGDFDGAASNLERLTSLKFDDENLKESLKALLFNIGLQYQKKGAPDRAIQIFERVSSNFPDFAKTYYYTGIAAIDIKDYDRAVKMLQRYLEMEPDDQNANAQLGIAYDRAKDAHYEAGRRAFDRKMFREALAEFEKVLDISPNYGAAIRYRDIVSVEVKKVLAEEAKRNAIIVGNLLSEGRAFLEDGELLAALQRFEKARDIDPANSKVAAAVKSSSLRIEVEIRTQLDEAEKLLGTREYYKAMKSLEKVLYYDAGNVIAGKDLEIARAGIEKQIAPLLARADALMAGEQFSEAYLAYMGALKINPEDEKAFRGKEIAGGKVDLYFNEYLGMARDYIEVDQLDVAKEHYKKALLLKPADEAALGGLARVEQMMGRIKSVGSLLGDANSALVKGEYNMAITGFLAVLKLEPGNSDAQKGLKKARYSRKNKVDAMVSEAQELFDEGKYHETIDLCRSILALDKVEKRASVLIEKAKKVINQTVNPHIARGKELFDTGKIDEAIVAFYKAVKADPGNQEAKRYLSRVDEKKVLSVVESAAKKSYLSGLDAYTKGRYEESIKEWNSVLELNPGHDKAILNIDKAKRKLTAIKGG